MPTPDRFVPLVGAYNFRDLGGYPTTDGRVTKWARLFRSDLLHELTVADVEVLRKLGLAQVIDLRTGAEVERTGRGLLAAEPVRYLHLSVTQVEGGESVGAPDYQSALAQRYLWYLEVGRATLVETLTAVGDPASYPLVFHCAAGKDRTGVVAALILDILGVDRDVIVEDYALTATRMRLIIDRLRRDPAYGDRIDEVPAHLFAVEAATMQHFLELLHEQHGGAREWAGAAGVQRERLDALPDILLSAGG
jgi:protein tyrosine/serine phosphatase